MPDVSAEGGQEEADARKRSAAESCGLASTGPSSGEEREQERHGEVHDAVGGCADDTGDLMTPLQRPVAGIVFLKDAVIHGEACVCELDCNQDVELSLPQIGSCNIAEPARTQALFVLDSHNLESA